MRGAIPERLERIFLCVSITPFETPVVPDVKTRRAMSSAGVGGRSDCFFRNAFSSGPVISLQFASNSSNFIDSMGSSFLRVVVTVSANSKISSFECEALRMWAISFGDDLQSIGTRVHPAPKIPAAIITHVGELVPVRAT